MIFKWIIGLLKIAIGVLALIGSIMTFSHAFDSISTTRVIGGIIGILIVVGYGFSLFTNGLAEFKDNTYRKIFLWIETICGFLFAMGFIAGTFFEKHNLTSLLMLISMIIIFLAFSIRNIVIIQKSKNI